MDNGEQSDVGFASTGRGTDQEVLVGVESSLEEAALHPVKVLKILECLLCPLWKGGDGHELLVVSQGPRLERWHKDFFVALVRLSEGSLGQGALFVGHEVAALCEDEVIKVEHLLGQVGVANLCIEILVQLALSLRLFAGLCFCVTIALRSFLEHLSQDQDQEQRERERERERGRERGRAEEGRLGARETRE